MDDQPPEVIAILDWWKSRVCEVFENKLRGVFLFGSVALGEFAPKWSDIDTCIVVTAPVGDMQAEAMCASMAEMDERFRQQEADGWRSPQTVQGAIITPQQAAEIGHTETCFYARGSRGVHAHCDPFSAFDRYQLAHHRRLLWGNDVYFAPPSRKDLIEMAVRDMNLFSAVAKAPETYSPIMLAGMLHWAARSLVFWRDGRLLSKSAALKSEIVRNSSLAKAFGLALKVRDQGSARAVAHSDALREVFRDFGPLILAEHEQVLRVV